MGIEFKGDVAALTGIKGFTSWVGQAVDYAHSSWEGYGTIPVFVCPYLLTDFHGSPAAQEFGPVMARLMWRLGVGELALLRHHGWAFFAQGDHVIWSERYGVRHGRIWSLRPRIGSR